MSDNDRIVLKTILEQNRDELATELTDSEVSVTAKENAVAGTLLVCKGGVIWPIIRS